jgi:hypothetical protein
MAIKSKKTVEYGIEILETCDFVIKAGLDLATKFAKLRNFDVTSIKMV